MTAPNNYYVDPTGVVDGGLGTKASPWTRADGQVEQYALDNITRDTTDGDIINIKSGARNAALTGSLDLTTFGFPSTFQMVMFRGYTTDEGDGGIGDLDCGGNSLIAGNPSCVHFADLKLHNFGANAPIAIDTFTSIRNCEITNGTTTGDIIALGDRGSVSRCYIHTIGSNPTTNSGAAIKAFGSQVVHNYVDGAGTRYSISLAGARMNCEANVITVSTTDSNYNAILGSTSGTSIRNNTIYNAASGGGQNAIDLGTSIACLVEGNLIEGFSKVGAYGITDSGLPRSHIIVSNRFYNCDSNLSSTIQDQMIVEDNSTLSASPFTNAAGGDFSVGTEAQAGVSPETIGGTNKTTTSTYVDFGAAQSEATSGGSCGRHIAIGGCAG